MSSRTRRYVAVGILAAMTSLVGAPPAQAREISIASRAWQWMQEAWWFNGLPLWTRLPAAASNAQRTTEKGGPGLDPNGKPAPSPSPTSSPTCESCSDAG